MTLNHQYALCVLVGLVAALLGVFYDAVLFVATGCTVFGAAAAGWVGLDRQDELERLKEIEHLAWHVCNSAADGGLTHDIAVGRTELEALCDVLPEDHPGEGE